MGKIVRKVITFMSLFLKLPAYDTNETNGDFIINISKR